MTAIVDRARALAQIGAFLEALELLAPKGLSSAEMIRIGTADLVLTGSILTRSGRFDEAERVFDHLVERERTPEARARRAKADLFSGRLDRLKGEAFDLAFAEDIYHKPFAHIPRWQGQTDPNATILVYEETTLGDLVQFARFLEEAGSRVGALIVAVEKRAIPLVERLGAGMTVIDREVAVVNADVRCGLLGLPGVLDRRCDRPTSSRPYLPIANPNMASGPDGGLTIGVVWAANPKYAAVRRKSTSLEDLRPLFDVPNMSFDLLQDPARAREAEEMTLPPNVRNTALDLDGLVAAIEGLDGLVTVDTGPAHIAAAMGLPVFMLLAFHPDWRWVSVREGRTPWYPSMEIY